MIEQLPCGCTCVTELERPAMEHVTEYAARFFDSIGYPAERLVIVCWIRDGVRSSSHRCATREDGA